jgi:hypothetical protein
MVDFAPTFSVCRECGLMHPPVQGPCPMAPVKSADGSKVNLQKFLDNLKVQLQVKIETTKFKSIDNFFIYISTELNNLIKNYKE